MLVLVLVLSLTSTSSGPPLMPMQVADRLFDFERDLARGRASTRATAPERRIAPQRAVGKASVERSVVVVSQGHET